MWQLDSTINWGIDLKRFNGQRVVVTGGAGFIGSNLCRKLLELGAKVTVFDNLYSGKMEFINDLLNKDLNVVKGDIRYPTEI